MHAMDHHEAWEMKPRKLSIEELEQPEKVVEEFFQFAQLPQVRWYMWEEMKTLITGSFGELDSRDRSNLIYFHEQLEKLIETVYVLHSKKKPRTVQLES